MNSTSFREIGGSFARVEEGNDLVACPGAPGWTTDVSFFWAETGSVHRNASAHAVSNEIREALKIENIAVMRSGPILPLVRFARKRTRMTMQHPIHSANFDSTA